MLGDKKAQSTVAVRDLGAAKKFYEGKLGLKPARTGGDGGQDDVALYEAGGSTLVVYVSKYAGTNRATGVTWSVGSEVDAIAKALKENGVSFERYDMPGMTHEGDVHVQGDMRVAWFQDPDGNIHALASE
ncbi:MAG: VOC family protein [Acidobacteriota bacterium]